MYIKFIEEHLIQGRPSINISYYCLPPCLSLNLLLKTVFKINAFECLAARNIELVYDSVLDGNQEFSCFFSCLFPKMIL